MEIPTWKVSSNFCILPLFYLHTSAVETAGEIVVWDTCNFSRMRFRLMCCVVLFIIHEKVMVSSFAAMVGDVNIYMNDLDNLELAEVEIMIAEPKRYLRFFFSNNEHVSWRSYFLYRCACACL